MWYIALAAWLGSMVTGLIGFLASSTPWDWRKFGLTALRGLITAASFAVLYAEASDISSREYILAFLGGTGGDTVAKRVIGALAKRVNKLWA